MKRMRSILPKSSILAKSMLLLIAALMVAFSIIQFATPVGAVNNCDGSSCTSARDCAYSCPCSRRGFCEYEAGG
jgi:hypothetical protein